VKLFYERKEVQRLLQSLITITHVRVAVIGGAGALKCRMPATEVSVGMGLSDGDAVKGLHRALLAVSFLHEHLGHLWGDTAGGLIFLGSLLARWRVVVSGRFFLLLALRWYLFTLF